LLAVRRQNIFLPFHFAWLLFRAFIICLKGDIDIIHFGEAVTAPFGLFLRKIFRLKVSVTVHGLDVTYSNRFYQRLILDTLPKMDLVVADSRYSACLCRKRGVEESKLAVIPVGVDFEEFSRWPGDDAKQKFCKRIGLSGPDARVIATVGRLVRRKGVLWFVGSVLGRLAEEDSSIVYVIAGRGPDEKKILKAINEGGLEKNARLVTDLNDDEVKLLYKAALVFAMPNISVPDDPEGFGIVALEASASGCPVVASAIDGITDAIQDGKNGFLLREKSVADYAGKIRELLRNEDARRRAGKSFSVYTGAHYDWSRIIKLYLEKFGELAGR